MELLLAHSAQTHGTAGGTGQNWFQTHPESRVVRAAGTGRSGTRDSLCAQQPQLPWAGHCREPRTSGDAAGAQGAESISAALALPADAAGAQG